jgi:hypothetical protein
LSPSDSSVEELSAAKEEKLHTAAARTNIFKAFILILTRKQTTALSIDLEN